MSGSKPRRRHSPAVYRRRRLVALLLLLAIVGAVVWTIVAQPWRGFAWPTIAVPTPSASSPAPLLSPTVASPSASATPTGEDPADDETDAAPEAEAEVEVVPCVARDLNVEAVTDKGEYASGEDPQLSIRLTNESDTDCVVNVGTSTQAFTITSGSDVWWRSTDCQTEPSDMVVVLPAGETVTSATPLVWDRTRSSVSSCGETNRPRAAGGGASYHVSVEIGGFRSRDSAFIMLY